jgi:UDP-glucose 4-epimerase
MKALVTGGCGFIGSNLVHGLVSEGWGVDVVDDMTNGDLDNLKPLRTRTITGQLGHFYKRGKDPIDPEVLVIMDDFCSVEVARRIINGDYDIIFHLAANPRVEYTVQNPVASTEHNLFKTVQLMAHSVGNVKRFVMASTSAVYGDPGDSLPTTESAQIMPESPYGVQKASCEQFGQTFSKLYDLDTVFLRLFNVYGPRQWGDSPYSTAISAWCDKIKNRGLLRRDGDGEQTRDLVFVKDVVSAFISAGNRKKDFKGLPINVGTGQRYSNNYILRLLEQQFTLRIQDAPARPGDVRNTQADISLITQELGWEPKFSLETGLDITLDWWGLKDA